MKSSPKPFAHFGPEERRALAERAYAQSLDPLLAHSPSPTKIAFLTPSQWPRAKAKA